MENRPLRVRHLLSALILGSFLILPLLGYLRPLILAEVSAANGRQAAAAGDPALAAIHLATAAAHMPARAAYWEAAGKFAWAAGDPYTAIHYLERAEAIAGLSSEGWVALGDSLEKAEEHAAATKAWEEALSHGGEPLELYERLAETYHARGDYSSLYRSMKGLAQVRPLPETFLQLGLLGAIFEPDAAFAYLTQAASLDPTLATTSETLQRSIRRARLINDDPAFLLTAVGRSLAGLGEWGLALESFERAVEVNPSFAEAWAFLGEARQKTGGDPRPALETAYTLGPKSVAVNAFYALYWLRQGRPDLAVQHLEAAAAEDPQNPVLMAELGNAISAAGDPQTGLQLFSQAVAIDPQNIVFWRLLASFSISNDLDVQNIGLPAARRAHFLDPADPASLDLMGRAYMSLGNPVLAERFLLNALQLNERFAPAALHLGMLYLGTGKTADARDHLARAVDLAPDSPFGEQAARLLAAYLP